MKRDPTPWKQCIFLVDDEPQVRKTVGKTLDHLGPEVEVKCFATAADCLEELRRERCDLLVTDVKMPDMDGIDLLAQAKRLIPALPVLVITGYGDVPMAVRAMKHGATDFVEKPLDRDYLLSTAQGLLKQTTIPDPLADKTLTKTEMTILRLILDGRTNKEIAAILHRSIRTVEDHRYNIMHKLSVDNLIDLVRRAATMGLFELPKE
ncbi:MAG: response regulator transcription factor [Planctomycetota bacterium]|jgi:FixJ family two-component response regulator